MLGLRFCARTFSSCGKRGPLFIAVHGPLTVAASRVAGHRLQTCRLSNCGSRAQLLRGMWDPPRPGLEPVSPALAGRFSITAPPGKPPAFHFLKSLISLWKKLPVRADLSLHDALPISGPAAPRHVGSSQTRARTRVPCIGRQILNHCATREALYYPFTVTTPTYP